MNDETVQPLPTPDTPETAVDPAILEAARASIAAHGGNVRTATVMGYPPALLNDLLERLADYRVRMDQTLEWLTVECSDRDLEVPSKSSFYRFAAMVREEYRLALLADRRRVAKAFTSSLTADDEGAEQLALNDGVTELLTDELVRAADAGGIETKRLMALLAGTRMVAQTAFDKTKMTARIAALEKLNEERTATIKLKEQQAAIVDRKLAAVQAKATAKKAITADDIAEVRKAVFG